MEIPMMGVEKLRDYIEKMKKKKAAADAVKVEVLMEIVKYEDVCSILANAINKIWEEEMVPNTWKESNTTMIKR